MNIISEVLNPKRDPMLAASTAASSAATVASVSAWDSSNQFQQQQQQRQQPVPATRQASNPRRPSAQGTLS